MKSYPIYAGGKFIETKERLEVFSYFTNSLIAETYLAGDDELEVSINAALLVENEMKNMSSHRKYSILMEIASLLDANINEIASVLAKEASKPMKYAVGEVQRAIQTFLVAAEESKRLQKEYFSVDWTKAGEGKEGFVKYFPIGIVAGISPFNFPLNLAVHKIAPAIAAGNPIILKPARSTPLSCLELAKLIDSTDLPKGALSVLPMDRVAGNKLVSDDRIKFLTFTGSSEVGWKMKQNAGKKKLALELGGNAGVIISGSADLEMAVEKCVPGAFAYSGQVCIHIQRIYVHESVFDSFAGQFVEKVRNLKYGDPLNMDTDVTCMIDEENAIRVEQWVNEASADGAELLCGGKRSGAYFEPTVITNSKDEMKICCLEVFGPVVTLEKYEDFENAVEKVNSTEYGLQAGVFTNSLDEMNYAYNNLDVGGVMINEVSTFRVDHMPYGGVKNSGMGREGVKYSIMEMMEPKLLIRNFI